MTTRIWAGLLALPILLISNATASAQYPGCAGGGCGPGPFPMFPTCHQPCPNLGCGGFCLGLFGRIHQHGPLFNYGPYCGYYPFEPYGPWTSDLRYNPPQNCGRGWGGDGCGKAGWGRYALDTLKNVFHRTHACGNKKGCLGCGDSGSAACGSCGSSACDGGCTPAASTGCAGCTALLTQPTAPVRTVGAGVLLTGATR